MAEQNITIETIRTYVGGADVGTVETVAHTKQIDGLLRAGMIVEVDADAQPELSATEPGDAGYFPNEDATKSAWEQFADVVGIDVPKSLKRADYILAVREAWAQRRLEGQEIVDDQRDDQRGEAAQGDA